MKRVTTLLLVFAFSMSPASADFSGGMNSTGFFGNLGGWGGFGSITPAVAVPCVPGAPTGQMDFSVCSNIAITAALW